MSDPSNAPPPEPATAQPALPPSYTYFPARVVRTPRQNLPVTTSRRPRQAG